MTIGHFVICLITCEIIFGLYDTENCDLKNYFTLFCKQAPKQAQKSSNIFLLYCMYSITLMQQTYKPT